MAQTYASSPVLSKVKFGNQTYYMKDADVRAILDTFGNIVTRDVATTISDGNKAIPTADLVYDFVGQQVGSIGTALNLRPESDHTKVNNGKPGDFIVESDGKEWLCVSDGNNGVTWREIGSENTYVVKSQKIAGIDMQDNIGVEELQQALGLKALAYKDSGSVKVTTMNSINSFSTGKAGEYNVVASSVSVPATYDALDVTPAGSVTIEAGTAVAASYDKVNSVAISAAAPNGDAVANYTPSGTVTVSNINITPSSALVATVTDQGAAYQLTDGSVTKASDTKAQFATAGVLVSVDDVDEEMLVFTDASKADAVTAAGDVTYVKPTLSGSLPTFGSQSVVTGISSASADASFSGNGTVLSADPSFTTTAATVTQPTFTGSFSGTSKTVTPTVATTKEASGTDGKVTVASETIAPTFKSSEKTVNVAFA